MHNDIRIILSDNCIEFTELFKARLELYDGIEVVGVAYNGDQTIDLLHETEADFLLLDIVMPEMNGLELLQRIKNLNPKPAVIVVSALGTDVIVQQALSLGAVSCFNKPVDCDKLVETMKRIMDTVLVPS
jgi:two-component system response regulator (stage 0 sporulation protein A)